MINSQGVILRTMKIVAVIPIGVVAAYVMDEILFGGANTIIVTRMARVVCDALGVSI
jgi:hypothetical protein